MRPEELVHAYQSLRRDYDAGSLGAEAFATACQELVAEDQTGTWWGIDTQGNQLVWNPDHSAWEPAVIRASHDRRLHGAGAGVGGGQGKALGRNRARGRVVGASGAETAPAAQTTGPAPSASATLGSLVIVFGLSLAASVLLWDVLKIIPVKINAVIPTGGCTGFTPGSIGMYFCSAFVGLRVVFGSLVLAVLLLILRKPIAAFVGLINQAVPAAFRSVMPAVVAAVFFAVVWAGSHADTGAASGLLPQRMFPALVGVFTHLVVVFGPSVMTRFSGVFDARDRLSMLTRWVIVFATPTLVSLIITFQDRVSNEALKQQVVVLIGMAVAFVVMTPRSGKLQDLGRDLRKTGKAG